MAWTANFDDFQDSNCHWGNDQGLSGVQQPLLSGGKTAIAELVAGVSSTRIVGIVIAKEDPRHFPSKKDPNSDRHVLNFTIRDSPTDFINATCWGNEDYIKDLASTIHLGLVVELGHPGIQSKPPDGSDERFRPWTPSQCQLSLSENRGSVKIYAGWDAGEFNRLLQIPVKPSNDFYTIADIEDNGQGLHGQFVNLLAAVRSIGTVKNITTKMGRNLNRLEVKLFDETAQLFILVLWDSETITMAQSWMPKEHVILASDVRITFDDFKKAMIATATGKTIITLNPDTREAHQLYRYAQTAELPSDDTGATGDSNEPVELTSIHSVYNVDEVKAKHIVQPDGGRAEYGIVYAHVTTLDLDGDISSVVAVKCSKCKFRVDKVTQMCCNPSCAHGAMGDLDFGEASSVTMFELRVSLSDHTGTLDGCYLSGDVAEKMLNCTVQEFLSWDEQRKTSMKWKFLMEKCKAYIKMVPPSYERTRAVNRIISLTAANLQEAARYLH